MSTHPTDADLIRRSLDDPAVFGDIFERHYDRIVAYLVRRAGPNPGSDLAAQVFEEAFRHRSRYDLARSDAAPWLFGIASNLLSHHARAQKVRFDAYAKVATRLPRHAEAPEEALEAIVALPIVTAAIAAMPPGDRDAILLYAWADLSYPEIADALGIPIGTVRSRINRVRTALRELIDLEAASTDEEPER